MVATLYLIRHGETEGSGEKRYHGSIDIALSERGIIQVQRASAFIRAHLAESPSSQYSSYLRDVHKGSDMKNNSKPDVIAKSKVTKKSRDCEIALRAACNDNKLAAVYCSDLSRAVKSAEIIAQPYGLIPTQSPHLRERSFGIWEGMTFLEIKEKYPVEFESWADNPVEYGPMGGESTIKVKERIIPELDRIVKNHSGENIAIVAHGGINRIVLCHILGMPLENIFRIEQDYGAVNIIEFWDKYPVVKLVNGRTVPEG